MVEAETDTCAWPITSASILTDEWFSYSNRQELTDTYEQTAHSGSTYYHVTATPWPNGSLNILSSNISGLPTQTYAADGEGRISTVSAGSGQNPVTSTTYNALSQATAITFGSSDNDSFTFDPNTGRMTQYQYNVGTGPVKTVQGGLTWNANGTLKQLAITDPLNAADTQTCNYGYDDLARVASANCGSPWAQTFSFDPFSNINKSGSITFNASYILSGGGVNNQIQTVSSSPVTYDGNGNITNDTVHTYTWNVDGNMVTVDSGSSTGVCLLYDAFGRMAEQQKGSTCSSSYQEIVYGPTGKLALMNSSTLTKAFIPLPSGAQAVYTSTGLSYYRHADWLGSSRLSTTTSRTLYYSVGYAPYGEPYGGSGTQDLSFTGQNQDTKASSGSAGGFTISFTVNKSPVQGRWPSPDPAGLGAVDPANPQTWNLYAYVGNEPCGLGRPARFG